jgi:hypothetical protein
MPTLDILEYKIDFIFLESNDPKLLILLDRSRYLTNPEKPRLQITLPGFTGYIETDYNINGITVIDSDKLKLTESCEYNSLIDLPDGIYKIKQMVCPTDELFIFKCYLKTQQLEFLYSQLLLSIDNYNIDINSNKILSELVIIDILIKSARAEAAYCNSYEATNKYNLASEKINKLTKLINNK